MYGNWIYSHLLCAIVKLVDVDKIHSVFVSKKVRLGKFLSSIPVEFQKVVDKSVKSSKKSHNDESSRAEYNDKTEENSSKRFKTLMNSNSCLYDVDSDDDFVVRILFNNSYENFCESMGVFLKSIREDLVG